MNKKITKTMELIMYVVGILLLCWFLGSWIEVVSHNCGPNPTYSMFNLFKVLGALL